MMILILTDYYEAGYITQPKYKSLTAFFPHCNLAIRRQVFNEIGLYDEQCRAGEDADICRRAAEGGWELFYERGAACQHEAKKGLAALAKQWFWYGYEGGYFFQKWQEHRCEIFVSLEARPRVNRYERIFRTDRTPFRILVFLSFFALFHLGLLLMLLLFLSGWRHPALLLGGGLAAATAAAYLKSSLRKLGLGELLTYFLVTYVINVVCITSSLAGGLKRKMLFIYPGV